MAKVFPSLPDPSGPCLGTRRLLLAIFIFSHRLPVLLSLFFPRVLLSFPVLSVIGASFPFFHKDEGYLYLFSSPSCPSPSFSRVLLFFPVLPVIIASFLFFYKDEGFLCLFSSPSCPSPFFSPCPSLLSCPACYKSYLFIFSTKMKAIFISLFPRLLSCPACYRSFFSFFPQRH